MVSGAVKEEKGWIFYIRNCIISTYIVTGHTFIRTGYSDRLEQMKDNENTGLLL